jgi:16S rRNA processing protein RimM
MEWTPTSTSSTTDEPGGGRGEGPARDPVQLLEVGRIVKPHGLRGEVVVTLVSNRSERHAVGSVLVGDQGDLRVESARPFGANWLMTFAGVTSRQQAEALRATVLRAPPLVDDDAWWVHELIGSEVVTAAGVRLGTVRAVVDNPVSDLLELDGGELVPLRFVVERGAGRIVVELPEGLVDPSPD